LAAGVEAARCSRDRHNEWLTGHDTLMILHGGSEILPRRRVACMARPTHSLMVQQEHEVMPARFLVCCTEKKREMGSEPSLTIGHALALSLMTHSLTAESKPAGHGIVAVVVFCVWVQGQENGGASQ